MKLFKITLIFIGLFLAFSCIFMPFYVPESMELYKLKNDYSSNAYVRLTEDKTEIQYTGGEYYEEKDGVGEIPIVLCDNYLLFGTMGINTAYLSITKTEWDSLEAINKIPSLDSLYKLIIDDDPFLEYYFREDDSKFWDPDLIPPFDTARLNNIIKKNELEKYFERLK